MRKLNAESRHSDSLMRPHQQVLRGFTLLELLVVVSLLLILSSVAMINLSEAQTRARVGRVHADSRTIASALEIYRSDNETYPIAAVGDYQLELPLIALTTPCAYLNACPVDPFGTAPYDFAPEYYVLGYNYLDALSTSVGLPGETYGHIWRELPQKKYMIHSCGPNRRWDVTPFQTYDASNGTLSNGDICFMGPIF